MQVCQLCKDLDKTGMKTFTKKDYFDEDPDKYGKEAFMKSS